MRLLLRAVIAALVALAWAPAGARGQEKPPPPPLEDVTLRGRVLHADGSPLVNTPLRVDAVKDEGFAIFAFFGTLGFSALTCFVPENEACPLPNSKRYNGITNAKGEYSFTFPKAKRRGEQTNTDYVLSVGVASKTGSEYGAVGSYELELLDAVHNAPDLVLWNPEVKVTAGARAYSVGYEPRPNSKNGVNFLIGDKAAPLDAQLANGTWDMRALEDSTFHVLAKSSKDVTAAGTIYHQRFTAAPVTVKGTLVPLSRGASCSATRKDGTRTGSCGYTNGDLTTPGVVDSNQPPVTEVSVDLGEAKEVGEVRSRCSCQVSASVDGATWSDLPQNGVLGTPQSIRYVKVTGASLASVPEVSVWGSWPAKAAPAAVAPSNDATPSGAAPSSSDDDDPPWLLTIVALLALVEVSRVAVKRAIATRGR